MVSYSVCGALHVLMLMQPAWPRYRVRHVYCVQDMLHVCMCAQGPHRHCSLVRCPQARFDDDHAARFPPTTCMPVWAGPLSLPQARARAPHDLLAMDTACVFLLGFLLRSCNDTTSAQRTRKSITRHVRTRQATQCLGIQRNIADVPSTCHAAPLTSQQCALHPTAMLQRRRSALPQCALHRAC
jgi:hypothetical protein